MPHWDNLRLELCGEGVKADGEPEEKLARHPAVLCLLRKKIDAALREVASCEKVKKFLVLSQPFSVANDELTVSLKLRRKVVLTKHQAELEQLYRE